MPIYFCYSRGKSFNSFFYWWIWRWATSIRKMIFPLSLSGTDSFGSRREEEKGYRGHILWRPLITPIFYFPFMLLVEDRREYWYAYTVSYYSCSFNLRFYCFHRPLVSDCCNIVISCLWSLIKTSEEHREMENRHRHIAGICDDHCILDIRFIAFPFFPSQLCQYDKVFIIYFSGMLLFLYSVFKKIIKEGRFLFCNFALPCLPFGLHIIS